MFLGLLLALFGQAEAQEVQAEAQVFVEVHRAEPPAPIIPPPGRVGIGLSAGMITGFGPTLGVPFGERHRLQVTALPFVVPGAAAGSGGVRIQHFIGRNPRSRLYVAEGAAIHLVGPGGMIAAGLGFGVETRKNLDTGRVSWVDVTMTGMVVDGMVALLPLPQAGVAWYF